MDELLILTRAVAAACEHALVIGDLPFMSYQVSDEDAVRNGGRFIKEAGADAVKLEGGGSRCSAPRRSSPPASRSWAISASRRRRPRCSAATRPRAASGSTPKRALRLGCGLEAAGCFAIVLECVPEPVAAAITRRLTIPTIGIGSGAGHRRPGAGAARPARHPPRRRLPARFVKRFAHIGAAMREGVAAYANEVRAARSPLPEHAFPIAPRSSRPSRPPSRPAPPTTTSSPTGSRGGPAAVSRMAAMTTFLHTMVRITDPDESRAFYEALGFAFSREMDIVRNGEKEATNYFFSLPGERDVLELTYNHDGRTYDARHRLRPHRDRRRRPRRHARCAEGTGHRAGAPAVHRERGRLAPLLRPRPGSLQDRDHRARLSPMSGCLSPKRAQIVFWQKTRVSIAYGAKLA